MVLRSVAVAFLVLAPVVAAAQVVQVIPRKVVISGGIHQYDIGKPQTPPASILMLGEGYNALTGEYSPNICVNPGRVPDQQLHAADLGGAFNHEYMNVVGDLAAQEAASGASGGFGFTYELVSVGFSAGSDSASAFNSVDQSARVYRRLVTRGEARIGGSWSPTGITAIGGTVADFTRLCGTHYIRAIYYGSVLDQTLRFKLHTEKYQRSDRDSLSIGIKDLFGFDYSAKTSSDKVKQNTDLTITDDSRGLINAIPTPQDASAVPNLVQYARETFPKQVAGSTPEEASMLLVELVPYYQLDVFHSSRIPSWPNEIENALVERAPLYEQFLSAMSDLEFALSLPADDTLLKQVYADTRSQLDTKLQLALKTRDAFRAAAKDCKDLLGSETDDATARAKCEAELLDKMKPQDVTAITPILASAKAPS